MLKKIALIGAVLALTGCSAFKFASNGTNEQNFNVQVSTATLSYELKAEKATPVQREKFIDAVVVALKRNASDAHVSRTAPMLPLPQAKPDVTSAGADQMPECKDSLLRLQATSEVDGSKEPKAIKVCIAQYQQGYEISVTYKDVTPATGFSLFGAQPVGSGYWKFPKDSSEKLITDIEAAAKKHLRVL